MNRPARYALIIFGLGVYGLALIVYVFFVN